MTKVDDFVESFYRDAVTAPEPWFHEEHGFDIGIAGGGVWRLPVSAGASFHVFRWAGFMIRLGPKGSGTSKVSWFWAGGEIELGYWW